MDISLHTQKTLWGQIAVGFMDNKICHLSFAATRNQAEQNCYEDFPDAHIHWEQHPDLNAEQLVTGSYSFALQGTPFQMKVWTELQKIPLGSTISYAELARRLHMPTATRAVASAVARNKISLCIPCHRVIHSDGTSHKYRWGADIKKALLSWEQGR